MKFSAVIAFLLPSLTAAFAPNVQSSRIASSLGATPGEEDLAKTRQVIMSFMDGGDAGEPTEEEDVDSSETEESEN